MKKDRLIGLIILILVFHFFIPRLFDLFEMEDKSVSKDDFIQFYNEEISGRIVRYNIDRGRYFVKIDNKMNREFVFYPMPRKYNSLYNTIQIGDSLIKDEKSEIFTLKNSDNRIYEYEVYLYEN